MAASARLQGRLALALAQPARFCPDDMTGIAPLAPQHMAPLYAQAGGDRFQRALAVDLGLDTIAIDEDTIIGLRTRGDVRLVARIATATLDELHTGTAHLAAAIFREPVCAAVLKRERAAFAEALGAPALHTAQRQAEVFWPALTTLKTAGSGTALADAPDVAEAEAEAPADWQRPGLSRTIAARPPMLRHAWAVLHAYMAAIAPACATLLQSRFGRDVGVLPDATQLTGAHAAALFDLLPKKVPQWSMSSV